MPKNQFVYFDTEFTELTQKAELLSIGLVRFTGKFDSEGKEIYSSLYIEVSDYDDSKINDWVRENVIGNFIMEVDAIEEENPNFSISRFVRDKKANVSKIIKSWLGSLKEGGTLQLVSDVCSYDMVLFSEIFGGSMSLPHMISPTCLDINTLMALNEGIYDKDAFDLNREEYYNKLQMIKIRKTFTGQISNILDDIPDVIRGRKHNALWDAFVIAGIHKNLTDLALIKR